MNSYPKGSGVQAIVIPLDNTRDLHFNLPDGIIVGVAYSTTATTGSPTTVTSTLTDGGTLSVATAITQTAAAITEATMPSGNISIDAATERALKIAITFSGGSSPTWKGAVTLHYIPGAVAK